MLEFYDDAHRTPYCLSVGAEACSDSESDDDSSDSGKRYEYQWETDNIVQVRKEGYQGWGNFYRGAAKHFQELKEWQWD